MKQLEALGSRPSDPRYKTATMHERVFVDEGGRVGYTCVVKLLVPISLVNIKYSKPYPLQNTHMVNQQKAKQVATRLTVQPAFQTSQPTY